MKIKSSLVLLLVSLLSACISVTKVPTEDVKQVWDARANYLYQLEDWEAQLSLVGVTNQQKFKARVVWYQQTDDYQIKLRDFIGRTIAIIDGSPSEVVAKTSKGKRYQGDDAETLIDELFAINIPVTGMRYWLQGLPLPSVEVEQLNFNDEGLAHILNQQGWKISYPYYMSNNPYKMPSQVLLEFEDIELNVKISQWKLSP
ncbi:MAG: lipoprotein insertase outer membrane protein LolB [Gammaproteobacteria bacterium]|nr:lipoprotein insertase outer membrane protein LolB [Gammaproteobacteria bacterium]